MGKCAIYARVSTVDKQDYNRQISDCITAINGKYADADIERFPEQISGYKKNEDRPQLTNLLNIIEKDAKYFDVIYITEISRLGRDPKQTRELIDSLTEKKIPIHITSINRQTLDENGERDSIMNIILQVLIEFADAESRTMKKRSKSGLRESAKKGNVGGGAYQPYGYQKKGDEKVGGDKTLMINDKEAEVIKMIYNYYIDGLGFKKIAGILNQKNIPTRTNLLYDDDKIMKATGKQANQIKWSDKTINDIVTNPLYKGVRRLRGDKLTDNSNYTGEITKDKNGEKYETIYFDAPAIIKVEDWDKCNEILKTKTHRNYLTTYTYLLKDLLVCGCCGRNYFAKYKPVYGGDKVYVCSSRLIKGGNCGNVGVNISLIESAIYNEIVHSPDILNFIGKKDIKKQLKSTIESLQHQLEITTKELSTIENKQNRLLDLFQNSTTMKVEDYDIRQSKLINEQKLINEKISVIKKELSQNKSTLAKQDNKKATQQMLIDAKDNRTELANLYKQFIKKIVIKTIDKKYTSIALYASINGIELAEPLRMILDLSGLLQRPLQYRYISYFNKPFDGDENIEDYYDRLKYDESVINTTPFTTITDNLISIEKTYQLNNLDNTK